MPGGLARFASDAHAEIVSMQRGGGSKDIWVLCDSDEAVEESTAPIARIDRTASRAGHRDLPSTLAENLFWMGRYAERCEFKMRILRATLGLRRNLPFCSQAMEICKHYGAARLFDAQKRFTLSGDVGTPRRVRGAGAQQSIRRELARPHGSARATIGAPRTRGSTRARPSIDC